MTQSSLPTSVDVVVAGGGVIGLATALALSDRGRRVCVVDAGEIGRQCSWAGGGMLSVLPPLTPVPALEPLLSQSLAIYPSWCERLLRESGIDPEYWVCGAVYRTPTGDVPLAGMAQVRNPRLLKALRAVLSKRGVALIEHVRVEGWRSKGDHLRAALSGARDIACTQAVVAAGAWSSSLMPQTVRPIKGQMLLLQAPLGALTTIVLDDAVYLIPRRNGLVLLGSTVEDVGFDPQITEEAREQLLAAAHALWPQSADWPVLGQWSGFRPCGHSTAPIIEACQTTRGLFYNTGHYRLGLTLAPASAQRLVRLMNLA